MKKLEIVGPLLFRPLIAIVLTFILVLPGAPSARSESLPKIKSGDPLPADLFIRLGKKINPTVVNIFTETISRRRPTRRGRGPGRDPFFDLFEEFLGPQFRQQRPVRSLGTGFIIRKDGLIITNNHVVANADKIKVQLVENDKKTYPATIVGKDARSDIALIKIDTKMDLPFAELGSSKDVQVGEWVAAFGNPYGHGHTMTKGIISALDREINELNRFPFMQTDASINPGNSGGPLVNTQGKVIGVNTAIDARAQGIGFTIPIDYVKSIIPKLEKDGGIRRGFIGIVMDDIDESAAKTLNLKNSDGALILQIVKNSPAKKAGLKPYDFIVKINSTEISSAKAVIRVISNLSVDDKVKIHFIRDGKTKKLSLKIGSHPENAHFQTKVKSYKGQKAPFKLGFLLTNYSQKLARELNLPPIDKSHPVITEVTPGSVAERSGLAVGDIVLDVNRRRTANAVQVLKVLKKKGVNLLRVLRRNRVLLISVKK